MHRKTDVHDLLVDTFPTLWVSPPKNQLVHVWLLESVWKGKQRKRGLTVVGITNNPAKCERMVGKGVPSRLGILDDPSK